MKCFQKQRNRSVHEPIDLQRLENMGHDVLDLLIRHDKLWPLINSIITESELVPNDLSEAEQQQALNSYRQRHNLKTPDDINKHCKKHGFNQDQFQWQVQLQERILRSSKSKFAQKAELHYLTCKEKFDQVSYSQLITKDMYFAQEIFLRLHEEDEKFDNLAKEIYGTQHKNIRWQVGPIATSRIPSSLAKPLQSVTPGTLLEPIRVNDKWFIVRLDQYKAAEFDESIEQRMCLELFQQHINTQADKQIELIIEKLAKRTPNQSL